MFGPSLTVLRIFGISIGLHWSLVIAVGGIAAAHFRGFPVEKSLPLFFVVLLSVLLHELGHVFVAVKRQVRILGIDLHLLGGVAKMVDPPRSPRDEVDIAAAGPLVSLALAFGSGLLWLLLDQPEFAASLPESINSMQHPVLHANLEYTLGFSARLNAVMGVFNLLPALPMDGGRVLRALLSRRAGLSKGTRQALWISRFFASLFIAAGAFVDGGLWLMGLFVLWMGREEGLQMGWHDKLKDAGLNDDAIDPWAAYERAAVREGGGVVESPKVASVLKRRQTFPHEETEEPHQKLVQDDSGNWRVLQLNAKDNSPILEEN
ncbi:MAG: hypothetical protein GY822_10430 [Deltaproteobacteria bacterium]|nr:hypothetical protein [Deltaproteobacteria bacterium]